MSLIRTEKHLSRPEDHLSDMWRKEGFGSLRLCDRKMIYTTNAIESLNSTYRNLKHRRSVFPSDTALLRALYLATFEATQKWTSTQQSGIGRRYMVSWVLCMKAGYQNNKKQAGNRLLLTCYSTTVIYKARVKSLVFKLLTLPIMSSPKAVSYTHLTLPTKA